MNFTRDHILLPLDLRHKRAGIFLLLLPPITLSIILQMILSHITGAAFDLRPWLIVGTVLAWLPSLLIIAVVFSPWLRHTRMGVWRCTLLLMVAVIIHEPVDRLFHDYAEEYVIQRRIASGKDFAEFGPRYLYWELSGAGYSRGAEHAFTHAADSLPDGAIWALIWSPLFYFVTRRWQHPDARRPSSGAKQAVRDCKNIS